MTQHIYNAPVFFKKALFHCLQTLLIVIQQRAQKRFPDYK